MKVEFWVDENGNVKTHHEKNHKATAILRIMVTDLRPGKQRPGIQNIEADIAWRRTVKMADIKKDAIFQKVIADYLKKDVNTLIFRFCVNAGCFDCPCSPGIIVHEKGSKPSPWADVVWVSIANDDQDFNAEIAKHKVEQAPEINEVLTSKVIIIDEPIKIEAPEIIAGGAV